MLNRFKACLVIFSFFGLFLRGAVVPVEAHPIDITYLTLLVEKDDKDQPVPDNQLVGAISFNWLQAAQLIETKEGVKTATESALTLLDHHETYTAYLQTHLKLLNNDQACTITTSPIDHSAYRQEDVVFGPGVVIPLTITCPSALNQLQLENKVFLDQSPLQNNVVNIYRTKDTLIKGALLTSADPNLVTNITSTSTEAPVTASTTQPFSKLLGSLNIHNLPQKFGEAITTSLPLALAIVFILGFLHTLEAGHSKVILTSFMINKRAKFKDGLAYALVFTVTHISDLILFGGVLLLVNSFVEVFTLLPYLQIFSLYSLLFISAYQFMANITHFVQHFFLKSNHHHHHDHEHTIDSKKKRSLKDQIIIGFLTGLSPCIFGWSIFMIILSTKKVWTIFPVILVFGLGIFTALLLLVFLITKFKTNLFNRFQTLADLSPIISSLLLVIFSLSLLI